MTGLLSNPLATTVQLSYSPSQEDGIPPDLEVSLRWAGSTLLQSAGILLSLPQPTVAHAIVLLQRFYLLSSLRGYGLRDTVHASLYLASKLTECPVKPRDIINVTSYVLHTPSTSPVSPSTGSDSIVSEHTYHVHRDRLLVRELEILKALGFLTPCSFPHTLLVNYLQTLECLSGNVLRRGFGYLNDALVSPSVLYLTHQPHSLAVAAVYLAARECGHRLPERWWEVFDVEREELGFLVAGMRGVEAFVRQQKKAWRKRKVPWEREELEEELERRALLDEDEEDEEMKKDLHQEVEVQKEPLIRTKYRRLRADY